MKSTFIAICLWIYIMPAKAQYYCPDFLNTDWNGDSIHLYQHLDSGKVVYYFALDPSQEIWNYYNSNALQGFFNENGPNGDNSAMVIGYGGGEYIDLVGCCGSESPGDFISLSPYPILFVENSSVDSAGIFLSYIHNLFGLSTPFSNVIYRICPDRTITRLNYLPTAEQLAAEMSYCEFATEANDARLLSVNMDTRPLCISEQREISIKVSNFGTDTLHSFVANVSDGAQPLATYNWTGSIPTYSSADIILDTLVGVGESLNLVVNVSSPNGQVDQNTTNDTLLQPIASAVLWGTDTIEVDILTDGYGPQFYWDIKNSEGITIDSGGNVLVGMLNGDGAPIDVGTSYNDFTHYTKKVFIGANAHDCLTIRVLSGYAYGICCSYGSGYARFKQAGETIFDFTDFGRRAYGKLYTTFEPPLFASYAVTHTTNGLANGSITVTASGGVAPYQYSNDCGDNFGSSNEFGSLAAGDYCMVTKDAIGQIVTDTITVNSSLSSTDAPRGLSGLSVRPNPAKDNINIGFALTQSSTIGISVYNAIGQQVVSMPTRVYATGQQSVSIDVAVLPTGLYFVVLQDERGTSTARFEKR